MSGDEIWKKLWYGFTKWDRWERKAAENVSQNGGHGSHGSHEDDRMLVTERLRVK